MRMRGNLPALIVGVLLMSSPADARMDVDLDALFPDMEITWEDRSLTSSGLSRYRDVRFRSGALHGVSGQVDVAVGDDGISIALDRVVARLGNGSGVRMEGVSLLLSSPPDTASWGDPVCSHVEALERVSVESLRLIGTDDRSAARGGLVDLSRARVFQDPVREPCSLEGDASFAFLDVSLGDFGRMRFDDLDASLSLPLSVAAARTHPGAGSLEMSLGRFDHETVASVPTVGGMEIHLSVGAAAQRLFPLVHVMREILSGRSQADRSLEILQLWNAAHLSAASFEASAQMLRIRLPGVVPREMAVNFGRAGLTTLFASVGARGRFGENALLGLDIDLNGIFSVDLGISGGTIPVHPSAFAGGTPPSGSSGMEIPFFEIEDMALLYQDTGLNRVFEEIFGVPAGRYAAGLRDSLMEFEYEHGNREMIRLLRFLEELLRRSQSGGSVDLTVDEYEGSVQVFVDAGSTAGFLMSVLDFATMMSE